MEEYPQRDIITSELGTCVLFYPLSNKINSGPTVWYPFEYLIAETINAKRKIENDIEFLEYIWFIQVQKWINNEKKIQ